ncbi:DUF2461 domain-containing protein [Chryseobacterium formosus]|uniref:DUF2461 domain-containing protein n=1 Tax=Chryseobacterium formosus TaxID=1537363 RepID=A0ABT3XV61_9FLAO|nr:DUF2461 domain-containing protein [Chryseobacterium formosus]MCX8525557.1 DUF2461 domain-containing protein [Chryseobacterium formosus]
MIDQETFSFLKDLSVNNNKTWMTENKERYQKVKEGLVNYIQTLIDEFSEIDSTISRLDASKCMTRINRDMRFAKNAPPYKDDFYLVLNKKKLHGVTAGYYLYIKPGNCFLGGGVWNPQKPELDRYRQEVADYYDDFKSIIDDASFKKKFPTGIQGDGALVNVPKQFDENHPAGEFLRMKGFCTKEKITQKELMSKDSIKTVISFFEASKPLVDFLNRGIEFEY